MSNNILDAGRAANPFLIKMVGRVCNRQILTLGFIPYAKGNATLKNIIQAGCSYPTFGFVNSAHVDTCDKLLPEQVAHWKCIAEKNGWGLCKKLLDRKDFCLPTNCGYQFVFKDKKQKRKWKCVLFLQWKDWA